MVDSIGKKLEAARVKKKITIEDVARATKIRPGRIADIERDDYSNFPSLTYAKGFVTIYAKYLDVDASEVAVIFGNASEFAVSDYDYLANTLDSDEPVNVHHPRQEQTSRRRNNSGIKALFIIIAILIIVGILVFYAAGLLRKLEQVNISENGKKAAAQPAATAVVKPPRAIPVKTPSAHPAPKVLRAQPVNPQAANGEQPVQPANSDLSPAPIATPSDASSPEIQIRRAQPVPAASR